MLDRPVWASLTTYHSALSEGGALAKRYARNINLFASASDDGLEALGALAALVASGESAFALQVPDIIVPRSLHVTKAAKGVQM
ncbi:MAG: hypothetical protein ABIY40_06965 [Rhodanobacteraceae bacterium]